ncbi:MAG: amidohydrolase [Candidatus Brockarchaeota archaeon]|nr:amidohydrolase [Candidatus Brockarchaeota archaeon]
MRGFTLVNGHIYVSFKPTLRVEAAVIVENRVAYVGSEAGALSRSRTLGLDNIDLKGKTVLPGFIDAHMHLDSLGVFLNTLDLRGVRSMGELKAGLRNYAAKRAAHWILGRGWDQEMLGEKRYPTRWDIDEAVDDRPVVLSRVCGHVAVVNTRALVLTGLIGGRVPGALKNEAGVPTGVVMGKALENVRSMIEEQTTLEERKKLLVDALLHSASQGVTTVGFVSCGSASFKALQELEAELGRLPVRVRAYLNPRGAVEMGLQALKRGSPFLKVNGVKLFADGSLGARSALLSKPYSDSPETSGYAGMDEASLQIMVKEACETGMQVAVHAIGDKAIENTLKTFEAVAECSRRLRHRVEHASVLRSDLIEMMRRLCVVVVVQPHFLVTDWWVVSRVGVERAGLVYPFKTLAGNVKLGLSTDAPVEPLNPWETVYAATTRGKYDGIPLYQHTAGECLTLEEALHLYTEGSAYALLEEGELGTLKEGRLADMVIVDKDPFNVTPEEIVKTRVLATLVDGRCMFLAGGSELEGLQEER